MAKTMATIVSRLGMLFIAVVGVATVLVSAYDCPGSKTPPLVLKGKRFYDSSTNEYVPIKGIAYYPRPNEGPLSVGYSVDFFTDEFKSRWENDIEYIKELGVNAVRIYAVDPSKNHDAFMCTLSEAGIYVTLSLLADCEDCGIGAWVGVNAEPPLCYPSSVKQRGQFVIRTFSKYDNIIGFSAGNEVTIYADDGANGPREVNAPCQKKFLNDMRKYVSACSNGGGVLPRSIPIGIENWDGNSQTFDQHVYYHCRTDPNDTLENTEWFGINSYRHCDGSATTTEDIVGWQELKADFETVNFPGPVLFGEYGCREQGFPTIDGFETQRTWLQSEALYTPDYSDVFAGGFVFELSAEKKVIDDNLSFLANMQGLDVPTSEWPYKKFAKVNYGVGYFEPIDCVHDDSDSDKFCQYVKYPEFQILIDTLAKTDGNTVRQQQPGVIPDCPQQFPPLSFFDWPTDAEDNDELTTCLDNQSDTTTSTKTPTTAAPSIATITTTTIPTATTTATSDNDDDDIGTVVATPAPTTTDIGTVVATPAPTTTTYVFFPTPVAATEPTSLPTEGINSSDQCSDHSSCFAQNLTGSCCPTSDGVSLGCCDIPPTSAPLSQDGNESQSSARGGDCYNNLAAIIAVVSTLVVSLLGF